MFNSNFDAADEFFIGGTATNTATCTLDYFSIHSRALTPAEITSLMTYTVLELTDYEFNLALYEGGSYPGSGTTLTDLSIKENDFVFVGSPEVNNKYIEFNGSTDYIRAVTTTENMVNLTGQKTFNIWFKAHSFEPGNNGGSRLLSHSGESWSKK